MHLKRKNLAKQRVLSGASVREGIEQRLRRTCNDCADGLRCSSASQLRRFTTICDAFSALSQSLPQSASACGHCTMADRICVRNTILKRRHPIVGKSSLGQPTGRLRDYPADHLLASKVETNVEKSEPDVAVQERSLSF